MTALPVRIALAASVWACSSAMPAAAEDTPLLNGRNLDGWRVKKTGEALDGKAEALGGRFRVADGVLTIDPAVKGDVIIETAQELSGDLQIKFEFLPDAKCNNDLFLRGTKFDIKAADIKNLKVGEWNTLEIRVSGDKAEFRCNGEPVRTLPCKTARSPFGVRAEFGGIRFRNLIVTR
jgi:hypothetical protein